ncbi:MAG: M24 family metallopeptidase [Alphaproteobacteria bacterium]
MPVKTSTIKEKLNSLRTEFNNFGVDGFIVPRGDEYQGEYVAPYAERLAFMTGFTGSAGQAVILDKKAIVMSDGRYTIQLQKEVDGAHYDVADSTKITAGQWLVQNADSKAVIGYDPKLHTPAQIKALESDISDSGITLKPLEQNPVDLIWDDQPDFPLGAVSLFPEKVAGHSRAQKKDMISEALENKGAHGGVITLPDSICWLLNVRGSDVLYTPLVHSALIVDVQKKVLEWFVDNAKLSNKIRAALSKDVTIFDPDKLEERLDKLAKASRKSGKPVMLDFKRSAVHFKTLLENAGANVLDMSDPCIEPKAQKTNSEQNAIRAAHKEDGLALVKFLKWLSENAVQHNLTELDVADQLEAFRKESSSYKEPSFPTIAGFAGNGAIVHYRATSDNHAAINSDGLLLVDSGGQYEWGTTDITRTIAIGQPSDEMKENYTRVLKGHIGLSLARFPEGTTGKQIDVYARKPLWDANLDFKHGTGHGVGCFLGVHEEAGGGISARANAALKTGYLLSNEPGYYKENEYGIRIENLVLVQDDGMNSEGQLMHVFESVTLAPYDRSLIVEDMLEPSERKWLNDYHDTVFQTLKNDLDQNHRDWLKLQTAPL